MIPMFTSAYRRSRNSGTGQLRDTTSSAPNEVHWRSRDTHRKPSSALTLVFAVIALTVLPACQSTDEMEWPTTWPVQPAFLESGCAAGDIDCIETERRQNPL